MNLRIVSFATLAVAVGCGPLVSGLTAQEATFAPAHFATAQELTAAGKGLRGILYPSPTIYDVDGDGRAELLVGDLRGYVQVAKPTAKGLAWEKLGKLQSCGKPLKLNNW